MRFLSDTEIFENFDAFILDQWGVIHDGKTLYDGVLDFFHKAKEFKKPIVILSNSGSSSRLNVERMKVFDIDEGLYEFFMSSGEAVKFYLKSQFGQYEKCYLMSRGGNNSILEGCEFIENVESLDDADFVLLSGLDSHSQDLETFRPLLQGMKDRHLPMICANPDKVAISGEGGFYIAAGAVADLYKRMGGKVTFFGKPHVEIYEFCFPYLKGISKDRILMIGDSLHHDIQGGVNAGVKTLLLGQGILSEKIDFTNNAIKTVEEQIKDVTKVCEEEKIFPDFYRLGFC